MGVKVKILIATTNEGKKREYRQLLDGMGLDLVFPGSFQGILDLETGSTYRENAELKARYFLNKYGLVTLADDSGIEVDALGGLPGVNSARYCLNPGNLSQDEANNQKILQELAGVPFEKRGATFRCVICVIEPGGSSLIVEGSCRGYIIDKPRGRNGFGYDPLFYIPELRKCIAELGAAEKNRVSHRGQAVKVLRERWLEFVEKIKEG